MSEQREADLATSIESQGALPGEVSFAISFQFDGTLPSEAQSRNDGMHSFREDILDLRKTTSLFTLRLVSEVRNGDCTLSFPKSVRLFTEGKKIDHLGFAPNLSAHYTVSLAQLPADSAIATIAFDLRADQVTAGLLDSLNLIQKSWYSRELSNPPTIEVSSSMATVDLHEFCRTAIEGAVGREVARLSPPKFAVFVHSREVSALLATAHESQSFETLSLVPSFSGLCQNVLDYANQDRAEMLDSLDAIFADDGIRIISNHNTVVEVAEQSRSFSEGRYVVGTCPYLYLVHILAYHNEVILGRWVERVSDVYDKVQSIRQLLEGADEPFLSKREETRIGEAIRKFAEIRLQVMTDIRSNTFQNTFRYDTERDLFRNRTAARNLDMIGQYWTDVLTNCEQAIRDISNISEGSKSKRLNYILGGLTAVTVLSVIVDMRGEFEWLEGLALGASVASVVLAFVVSFLFIRRIF